jgi:hypothetical protein
MSITVTPGTLRGSRELGRQEALAALVAVWALVAAAVYLGHASHSLTLHIGTVFMLWRVWRGGHWSLALLRLQAVIGAGVVVAMMLAAWSGAVGLVVPTICAALLYAATGPLLFTPAVHMLRRGIEPARVTRIDDLHFPNAQGCRFLARTQVSRARCAPSEGFPSARCPRTHLGPTHAAVAAPRPRTPPSRTC